MKSNCFGSVWSVISVIFLLSLNSEASQRNCPKNSPIKTECGKRFTAFSFTNGTRKHNRISGGYDAKPGQFPSFVSVKINLAPDPPLTHHRYTFCSGVLIDTDVVLTAAHCLNKPDIISIEIGLGIIPPKLWNPSGVEVYRAKKFCLSHEFRQFKGVEYDYGIVKLEKQVQLSDVVQTACLPDHPISSSTQAYTVGVGIKQNKFTVISPAVAQVLPVKRVKCPVNHRGRTRICFRSNKPKYKGNTCGGDSGGPTYTLEGNKMVVVGLTSYGYGICMKGEIHTSVLADIFRQREHILKLIERCEGSRGNNLIDYDEEKEN